MSEQVPEMQPSASQNKEAEQAAAAKQIKLSSRLFEYAMKDQWEKVMEEYTENPECHMAKITEAEDTALHLAVSGGKLEVVYSMVEVLDKQKEKEKDYVSKVLTAKNKRGNTPLHTAAVLGNAHMCHCMASKDPNLIAERNIKNETPFFYAAQFGHKDAFLCLYFCYPAENRGDLCRSRDENGDNILHAAISGEHFDLAFQIICKYPELLEAVNTYGSSPLHLLATKTNAFKSCTRLGLFDRILYRCIPVHQLKEKKYDSKDYLKRFQENGKNSRRPSVPPNYETCVQFFGMIFGVVFYGMPNSVQIRSFGGQFLSYINDKNKKSKSISTDEENPQGSSKPSQGDPSSSQRNHESNTSNGAVSGIDPKAKEESEKHRQHRFPANYATFKHFFKFLMKFLMVILGLGFQRIKKIITKKERHTWAYQVMNKLIDSASMYKYSGGKTSSGNGGMTENFPYSLSLMRTASHHQDTETGTGQDSSAENKNGKHQNITDLSQKGWNDAMVEKYLGEYHTTGSVDSKTSKHAVEMRFEKKIDSESIKLETRTPILIAASNGITEMVEKILEKFPVAIQDVDAENKNVLLLAVENRQTHTFRFLIERKKILHESVFRHWDNQGNNAMHLAAMYGHYRPWLIPGSALQMQWEIKWYKFVKNSLKKHLVVRYNKKCQTPKQIFTDTHKALVKDGSEWLTKTSESCSFIAALIATVAFATAANIPGGVSQDTGEPILRNEPAFGVFAISSLVALCFSITALVFFLAILTSRFEEKDFANSLPRKLILGLTSLFTSIAAMLISFCAGHFFELRDKLKFAAFPIYTAACLPISFFALAQLPLYFDLIWAIIKKVPQRSYKEFAS
ncbi:hypothetical protein PTKIN_Ptkin09bG0224300 [Pterospermum kingtungense]